MRRSKRQLSLIITLLLLIAMIPGSAFAEPSPANLAAAKAADIITSIKAELSSGALTKLETEQARVATLTADPDNDKWNDVFALLPTDNLVTAGKFATEADAEAAMIDLIAAFVSVDYFGSTDLGGDICDIMNAQIGGLYGTFGMGNVEEVIDALYALDDTGYDYAGLADLIDQGTMLLENPFTNRTIIHLAAQEIIARVPVGLLAAAQPALDEAGWDAVDVVEASLLLAKKGASVTPGGGGLGGGGGSVVEDEVTLEDVSVDTETIGGQKVTTAVVHEGEIEDILDEAEKGIAIIIDIDSAGDIYNAELTGAIADAMADMEAILQIKTGLGSYTIPASSIDLAAIAAELGAGTDFDGITVTVTIKESAEVSVEALNAAAEGKFAIVVPPLDFEITCTYGGKTVVVDTFDSFVERAVPVPAGVDASRITTAVVLDANGTMKHIPTRIVRIGNQYYAVFSSKTNSTYAVIYNQKQFGDMADHWAKSDVNDMASRLVINGVSDSDFQPDRDITRAEFIAIVVRGLGLMRDGVGRDSFSDVTAADWFYDAVSIASDYGISNGNGDGTFAPNSKIKREEAMTMIARAAKIAGVDTTITASNMSVELDKLTGSAAISDWARESAAVCVNSGIIIGDNGSIRPQDNITRAETATIIKRMLTKADLI